MHSFISLFVEFFRYFTIATSVLGVLTSLYNVKDEGRKLKDSEIKFPGENLSYISSLAVIIPRVMILAVFVYVVGTYCAIVFIVHTVVTLGIAYGVSYKHMKSEEETDRLKIASRFTKLSLLSFANTFYICEYRLPTGDDNKELQTKLNRAVFVLFYIGNAVLLVIYVMLTNERKVWYFGGTISVGIVGFAVHLIDLFRTKSDQKDSSNQHRVGEESKPLPSS